jgi:hypothetical protein
MSKQALEAFKAKLADDETLRSEMTRILSQDGKTSRASVQDLAAFAKSRGYDFSPEEARGVIELSDDQLDSVSGGAVDMFFKYDGSQQTFNIESFSLNFAKISF